MSIYSFCEECPMRGECVGEIESIKRLSTSTAGIIGPGGKFASFEFQGGVPVGPTDLYAQYVNKNGAKSETHIFHGDSYNDAYRNSQKHAQKIGMCKDPTVTKKFLGLVSSKQCGALSD